MDEVVYRGYVIEIFHDYETRGGDPIAAAGAAPIIVNMSGDMNAYGGIDDGWPTLGCDEISSHLPEIMVMLGYCSEREAEQFAGEPCGEAMALLVNGLLWEKLTDIHDSQYLSAVAKIYGWMGVETLLTHTTDDYGEEEYEALVIATPEWLKSKGVAKASRDEMQKSAIVFSEWWWGDVYQYEIPSLGVCKGGFEGKDFEASGLLPDARRVIDEHLATA